MPVMDEFREERAALKNGTLKQKFTYFLDYYKWHVIITVAVIGFAASMIYQSVTSKDTAFFAALVNVFEITSTEEYVQGFTEYAGIDTDVYDVMFDSSMHISNTEVTQDTIAASQKLMVYIAASELDVILSDEATIEQYAYNDSFCDLREILTEEQLQKYEPYLYYMDQAVADAIHAAQEDPDYDYNQRPFHPDPKKPEAMDEPIPVGIFLDETSSLDEFYLFLNGKGVLAVPATAPNPDNVVKYVDFLFEQ